MNNSPYLSVVLPVYNEQAILEEHLEILMDYLRQAERIPSWEVIIVNDGSADDSGEIADRLAGQYENLRVLHHPRNYGMGQALKYGISKSRGQNIVTLDIDLSYSPDHIERMLAALEEHSAKLVLASPYMKGGSISNVPLLRKILSIGANRFLSTVAHGGLSTLTCMVRAYDGRFARGMILRATSMEIMPETIYKTMILRGGIVQVPADLDWSRQLKKAGRRSSMRIGKHMLATVLSGFVFRPFMFFILPGLLLLGFAGWVNLWMVIHFFDALQTVPPEVVSDHVSWAIAEAYRDYPHTFIVGLLSLMLAIQLLSLGILALQSKSYFEEIFHLGSMLGRKPDQDDD